MVFPILNTYPKLLPQHQGSSTHSHIYMHIILNKRIVYKQEIALLVGLEMLLYRQAVKKQPLFIVEVPCSQEIY